ncbi:hypothetical protein [Candidatus Uabimicrobium sp. HlEnr_7]|uniref:hypothetical protein n=1 Tax=Candidatus Uabimicrobium helgolandensis TaxID=3095367 RepID=UPI0035563D57
MEYYSFEKVLKELQMEEDELKRLVSEGEIRAFRDEDKMKFKKSDIDGLKKGRMTEPTIILPSGEPDDSSEDSEVLLVEEDTSETLLDIDDLDGGDSSSTTVPTVDFSSSDFDDSSSASETITEELTFEEDSGSYVLESSDDVLIDSSGELLDVSSDSSGETFIESDTGLQTEPLDMDSDIIESADFETDFADSATGDDTVPVDDDSYGLIAEDQPTGQVDHHREAGTIEQLSGAPVVMAPILVLSPLAVTLLILSTVAMLWTGVLMINNIKTVDTPLTGWFTDMTYEYVRPTYMVYGGNKKVAPNKLKKRLVWRRLKRDGAKRRR